MDGRRSQCPGPSPTLGSFGPSHQWRHKSWVSLQGPLCARGVSGTPHNEVLNTTPHLQTTSQHSKASPKTKNNQTKNNKSVQTQHTYNFNPYMVPKPPPMSYGSPLLPHTLCHPQSHTNTNKLSNQNTITKPTNHQGS